MLNPQRFPWAGPNPLALPSTWCSASMLGEQSHVWMPSPEPSSLPQELHSVLAVWAGAGGLQTQLGLGNSKKKNQSESVGKG